MHQLADLYWQRGDKDAACDVARRAIAGWEDFAKRWPLTDLDRRQSEDKRTEAQRRCSL